jgi:hypothetical protein
MEVGGYLFVRLSPFPQKDTAATTLCICLNDGCCSFAISRRGFAFAPSILEGGCSGTASSLSTRLRPSEKRLKCVACGVGLVRHHPGFEIVAALHVDLSRLIMARKQPRAMAIARRMWHSQLPD